MNPETDLPSSDKSPAFPGEHGLCKPGLNVEIRVHSSREEQAVRLSSSHDALVRWGVLGVVLLAAGLYTGLHLGKGWVPADDGILAQSALRVMEGQLPHRDFTEIYSGGLSMIHAAAFRAFGVNLMSLRICVFLFFLAWLPAVYSIALRFVSAPAAGLTTLLAVSWSFPNYPAAMPSWYNLFFATFGAAALLHYLEAGKRRWLFVAGICGGVSLLIKVIGAYYVAGVLLFLAFVEQSENDSSERNEAELSPLSSYRVFSAAGLLLFLITVIYFFHKRLGPGELYDFVLPASALVLLVLLYEWLVRRAGAGARFRRLLDLVVPFLGGLLLPIAAFLAPYARSGGIRVVFSGIAASVAARSVGLGVIRPLGLEKLIYAVALVALVLGATYVRKFQGKVVSACIAAGAALLLFSSNPQIVPGVWCSAALLTPLVVLSGVAIVLKSSGGSLTTLQQQRIVLLISLAGLCSFVQYPFAAPIYLSYSIPLTLLAAVAVVATARKRPGTFVLTSVMVFYLVFGVMRLVPDYIYELTHTVGVLKELKVERGRSLQIEFAPEVDEFVHFLQQHAPNGLIYAGNDCPEFYFLAGLKNVTRDDGGAPAEEVLKALRSTDVRVVVINENPFFPGARMGPEVRAEVARRFPQQRMVGIFHVFWRP